MTAALLAVVFLNNFLIKDYQIYLHLIFFMINCISKNLFLRCIYG